MANLVSYVIPNLAQGISQQPDAQRDPSQGEIQINGVSSIAEGLRKRDNTTVLAKVSASPFGDAFIHSILRDQSEEYLAVITSSSIRVFDLDGEEYDVLPDANAYDYLLSVTDARQQIRAVTIADYTFVINANEVVAMDAALAPKVARPPHECMVWVKQASYGNKYTVNINGVEAIVETAVAPIVSDGTTVTENRISSEEIADSLRRGLVGGAATTVTLETGLTGTLNATRTDVATVVEGVGGAQGVQVQLVGDGVNVTVTKTADGAGYEVGDEISVYRKELEADGYTGADAFDLVTVATVTAVGSGPLTGVTGTQSGSVLWFQSASAITVKATDAKANSTITAILSSVQSFVELPTIAPEGYQVEIEGDPGNSFSGYYVQFEPRDGSFGEGSWLETVSPGVEYKIDAATMPHVLIRTGATPKPQFWFGPVGGQTVANIPGSVPSWGERTCGDYDTAKDPSFVGNVIADIFIYKNRLGFLADENVILSRTREFFSFFPETVTTVLDTDPIDVVASNNRVSILKYAVPYQDELILFSAQYQFRFNAAETVLTPRTAQLTVLTQFEVDITVRPQQAGSGIIFAQQNGDWTQLREFSVRGSGTALTADAADLTGYVSSYVPSGIFKMTVNDTGNGLYAISGRNDSDNDYRNRIYTYKYFYRNTGSGAERVQSSWSHFELNGADQILQVLCVEEVLYLLTQYGNDVYLEKMPVSDRQPETVTIAPFKLLLDRRVTSTAETPVPLRIAAGVYDKQNNRTTFTLPYPAASNTQVWTMWDAADPAALAPVCLGETASGTTVVCKGDYSGNDVAAGEPFEFRYRFTKFKLVKDIGGGKTAVNATRTQVRNAKLRYHETGFFQVKTLPEHREPGLYTYDGTVSGVINAAIGRPSAADLSDNYERYSEGVFSIPIYGKGDQVYIELLSDKPIPCKFSTCEWVALLTTRSQALQ